MFTNKYRIDRYVLRAEDLIKISKNWIIYGAGVTGRSVTDAILGNVKYIVDTYPTIKSYRGIQVIQKTDLLELSADSPILVCTHNSIWVDEIVNSLNKMHLSNFYIYAANSLEVIDLDKFNYFSSKVSQIFDDQLSKNIYHELCISLTTGSATKNTLTNFILHSERQYLDIVPWHKDSTVLEGGVFDGATAAQILNLHSSVKVIGLDPLFESGRYGVENHENFKHLNIALWNEDTTLCFVNKGAASIVTPESDSSGLTVRACRIDSIFDKEIGHFTHLKLDIEGAELRALSGALETLRSIRPHLMISVYHSASDFYEIPLFLSHNLPDYQWHILKYSPGSMDTILYGLAQ